MPEKTDKKEPTDAQRLALEYSKSPLLMARMVSDIFSLIETPQEIGVHNEKVREICTIVGEGLPKVLEKIANVILENTVGD
jgi:hypothetical protein